MSKFYDQKDDRPTKVEKLLRAYKENELDDFEARDAFEVLIEEEVDSYEDDRVEIDELKDELEDLKEKLNRISYIADGY